MRAAPLLFFLALACRGDTADTASSDFGPADTDDDSSIDGDGDDETPCAAEVATVAPSTGETDVSTNAPVRTTFTKPVGEGEWALSVRGVPGTSKLADDGRFATFTPDHPFETDTAYVIEYEVCDADGTSNFRTVGGPLPPSALEGRTYAIGWDELTWVAPPGASLFASQVDGFDYVLVQVTAVDPVYETIAVTGAMGERSDSGEPTQAACTTAMDYGVSDFSLNPRFEVGPQDLALPTEAGLLTVSDLTVDATFRADGGAITDIELMATVDTRPLDALMNTDVCALLGTIADVCEPCDDGADKCLPVLMTAEEALWAPGVELDSSYDPLVDATCQ